MATPEKEEKVLHLRRYFSSHEQREIQRRAEFKCQRCGRENLDGDHVHIISPQFYSSRSYKNYPELKKLPEKDLSDMLSHHENGLWLCYRCQVVVDSNPKVYTPERLMEMMLKVPVEKHRSKEESHNNMSGPPAGAHQSARAELAAAQELEKKILERVFISFIQSLVCGSIGTWDAEKSIRFFLADWSLEHSDWITHCEILLYHISREGRYLPSQDIIWEMIRSACWRINSLMRNKIKKETIEKHDQKNTPRGKVADIWVAASKGMTPIQTKTEKNQPPGGMDLETGEGKAKPPGPEVETGKEKKDSEEVPKLDPKASELLQTFSEMILGRVNESDKTDELLAKCLILIMALVDEEHLPELEARIKKSKVFMPQYLVTAGRYLRTHVDLFSLEDERLSSSLLPKLAIGRFSTFRNFKRPKTPKIPQNASQTGPAGSV